MTYKKPSGLIRFETPAASLPKTNVEEFEFFQILNKLEKIRDQIGQSERPDCTQQSIGNEWLDDWRRECFELPARILSQYEADRHGSQLARILAKTKQMMAMVDRVIVVGTGGYCAGAKALMDACCQPYFNHLSRGQRGSRPRIFFVDEYIDNDAAQGLLHMLGVDRPVQPQSVEESWAVVAISDNSSSTESRTAIAHLLDALESSCDGNQETVRERFIAVAGTSSFLKDLAEQRGHNEVFPIPEKLPASLTVLSAVGLIPAALMGINVIWLLSGAAQIYEHFLSEKSSHNTVLQMAAINRWVESRQSAGIRAMRIWSQSLENAVRWYDLLLKACIGWSCPSVASITNAHTSMISTTESHPDIQLPSWVNRHAIVHNLVVEKHRFDPLSIRNQRQAGLGPDNATEKSLAELMSSAIEQLQRATSESGYLTTKLVFPRIDEYFMGQFFQLLTLATALERGLLGSDPYRQAASEPYKGNFDRTFGL